jgi:hypothetical protein
MKFITASLLLLAFGFAVFAQNKKPPIAKYDNKKEPQLVSLSNMLGDADGFKCKKAKTYKGVVVIRTFNDDETMIVVFTLKDAKDNRIYLNLNESQSWLLGREAPVLISKLLAKNSEVTVSTFNCTGGGSGIFQYADIIRKIK